MYVSFGYIYVSFLTCAKCIHLQCVCVCQHTLIDTHKAQRSACVSTRTHRHTQTRWSVYPVSIGLFWRLFLVETGLFWRLFLDLDFFPVSTRFFVLSEGRMLACVWCWKDIYYSSARIHILLSYTPTIHRVVECGVVGGVGRNISYSTARTQYTAMLARV